MHDAAEQRNAAAMAEVRAALEASQQAEQALLKRLQLQHSQQEALEDKGVSVLTLTLTLTLTRWPPRTSTRSRAACPW